ncbi:MAG: alpha/beta hydrolase family esterase [Geminicoccaceae bacterium]
MTGWAVLVAFVYGLFVAAPAFACGPDTDCRVEGGTYRVRPPAGWDGHTALPAAVFFHGWQDSASGVMRNEGLGHALSEHGVLLVAPNGENGDWNFPGLPAAPGTSPRDEEAFVDRVLADVERRFPIDRDRLWATGFSIGGSMVWYEACLRGPVFGAYAPIAGAFWLPMPTSCPGGPVNLSHIHGLTDTMVPLEGREPALGFAQGDVFASLALLRATDGCISAPTRFVMDGPLMCRIWEDCRSGRTLRLCLHPYGHDLRPEWVINAWEWVQSLPR